MIELDIIGFAFLEYLGWAFFIMGVSESCYHSNISLAFGMILIFSSVYFIYRVLNKYYGLKEELENLSNDKDIQIKALEEKTSHVDEDFMITTCEACGGDYIFSMKNLTVGSIGYYKIRCPRCKHEYDIKQAHLCDRNGSNKHITVRFE